MSNPGSAARTALAVSRTSAGIVTPSARAAWTWASVLHSNWKRWISSDWPMPGMWVFECANIAYEMARSPVRRVMPSYSEPGRLRVARINVPGRSARIRFWLNFSVSTSRSRMAMASGSSAIALKNEGDIDSWSQVIGVSCPARPGAGQAAVHHKSIKEGREVVSGLRVFRDLVLLGEGGPQHHRRGD